MNPNLRAGSGRSVLPVAVAAAAAAWAALTAGLLAVGGVIGMAALFTLAYGPLVLLNLPVALCLWIPVIFFEGLPGANNLPEVGVVLLVVGWLTLLRPGSRVGAVLRANRLVLVFVALFIAWALATLLWAPDRGRGLADMPSFVQVALIYIIVLSSLASVRHVRLLALCFALGVAASVSLGLAGGEAFGGSLYADGRLAAGMGDPNYLAVAIVAGLALLAGVMPSMRTLLARWMLGLVAVLLLVGFGATASRGGMVAAAAAAMAALWLSEGRRARVLGFVCLALVTAGCWFVANPSAFERITTSDRYGGSGRSDLWRLAWQEFGEHPIHGVGLDNFAASAQPYLREPGGLVSVKHVERGQETHNLYLGLLAETGLVGLLLYLVAPFTSVRAAVIASRRFDAVGDHLAASLARGAAVALIGALAGAFFLPAAADKRLWILFALGPALLAITATPRQLRAPPLRRRDPVTSGS